MGKETFAEENDAISTEEKELRNEFVRVGILVIQEARGSYACVDAATSDMLEKEGNALDLLKRSDTLAEMQGRTAVALVHYKRLLELRDKIKASRNGKK